MATSIAQQWHSSRWGDCTSQCPCESWNARGRNIYRVNRHFKPRCNTPRDLHGAGDHDNRLNLATTPAVTNGIDIYRSGRKQRVTTAKLRNPEYRSGFTQL